MIGPKEAIIYPTDCAIPDNSAACFALFALIDKNSNAKEKFALVAAPIKITEIISRMTFDFKIKPIIPTTNKQLTASTKILCDLNFIAIIGMEKLIGIPIN